MREDTIYRKKATRELRDTHGEGWWAKKLEEFIREAAGQAR